MGLIKFLPSVVNSSDLNDRVDFDSNERFTEWMA